MRGMPLIRAVLVMGVLVVFGWPLRVVTREQGAVGVPEGKDALVARVPESPSVVRLGLQLSFTRGAEFVGISHLGKRVWEKAGPGLKEAVELELALPKEGMELGVEVKWAGEQLSAMRMQLTLPDGAELERSVWGEGAVDTVVAFP